MPRRIVFIYAGSPDNQERYSPYSITRNLYRFLRERTEVVYYDWCTHGPIDIRPDDVVLGHPNYPPETAIHWIFKSNVKCHAKFLIHPLHTKRVEDNMPFDFMARQANKVFSITGQYWYDTIGETPFAHWKEKIVRLDMAIDANSYPFLRQKFNPVGTRKLVYIGSSTVNKNLGYLVQLMRKIPHIQLYWFGGSSDHELASLPNVRVTGWMDLHAGVAKDIIDLCDIFINVSSSDANPTTLLETASWGLVPIISKESGYWPHRTDDITTEEIVLGDPSKSIANIISLLHMPEDELLCRAHHNRHMVESKYNWDIFCNKVWDNLAGAV